MASRSKELERPSSGDLAAAVLDALAMVRATSVSELQEEMAAAGGDLEIDSREAEAVIAMLESSYGRTLARVEDLEPERLASIDSLAELLYRRWPEGNQITTAGTS
jgi:hypothetical protein